MVFKKFLAGATALALVMAPEVALAQTSAAGAAATQVAPAVESVEGDSELLQERRRRRGGFFLPAIAVILIGLGIYIWLIDDNEGPGVSPG